MENNLKPRANGMALIPFLVFIATYLLTGMYLQSQGVEMAFYQMPAPVAAFLGIIVAFLLLEGSIDQKFNEFVAGCGNENIIIMCLIYILAGAFSTVAKASGGVDSTVNLFLTFIPAQFVTAGIFLMAAFISLSTGTSVGTITALGAIAVGLAEKGGLNTAMVLGSLVGGAMFGDNLSIISDTTIAATRTQNVAMKDKFRMNFKIALPSAILTFVLLLIVGRPVTTPSTTIGAFNIIEILPYIFVLVTALMGMNVFLVLTGGILFSGIVLLMNNGFNLLEYTQLIYGGFSGMFEIFLLSMLMGGLSQMVTKAGGLEWLIQKVRGLIKGEKSAEVGIAALVSLADVATANNTVAIIITGPVAKEICNEYHVDPRRSASLLDTFSCVMQGVIPYGAQILMAAGFSAGTVSPMGIIPFLWYQLILAVLAIVSIYVPYTKAKDKWNFEHDLPESKVSELQ